jgi:hypothetical protein
VPAPLYRGQEVLQDDIRCPRTNPAHWKVVRSDVLDQARLAVLMAAGRYRCRVHKVLHLAVNTPEKVAAADRTVAHSRAPGGDMPVQPAAVGQMAVDRRVTAVAQIEQVLAMVTCRRLLLELSPVAMVAVDVLVPSLAGWRLRPPGLETAQALVSVEGVAIPEVSRLQLL